jgi:hypothetical protein
MEEASLNNTNDRLNAICGEKTILKNSTKRKSLV